MKSFEEKAEIISEKMQEFRVTKQPYSIKKIVKMNDIAMLWFMLTSWEEDTTPRWKDNVKTILQMHIAFFETEDGEIRDD